MGLGSSLKKGFKKITKGVKKAFNAVKKVGSKVASGLRKAGREIKRFAKSDLGKIVIAAALIYAGGAYFAAMNSGGAMTFTQALANPAAVGSQLGSAVGLGGEAAGASASSGTATSVVSAGFPTAEAAITAGTNAGLQAGAAATPGGINLGAGLGAGVGATGAGTAGASTSAGGLLTKAAGSEMLKYGGMMVAGNAVSGMAAAKQEEDALKEVERQRQRIIDGNVVGEADIGELHGFRYDPVTGQEGVSTDDFQAENLVVSPQKDYTTQGLLKRGKVG